jgi:3-dehydroquinate dehydratase type II
MTATGLELGATWVRAVALRPDGSLGERVREPTPETAEGAARLLFSLWQRLGGGDLVGLAAAPELDGDGKVRRWPNRPEYEGAHLLAPFAERGVSPLLLDDASAASVAEHLSATEETVLPSSTAYVSVGTGVGAGVVLNDSLWVGATGRAMDLGHVYVPAAADTPCACGRRGCLQAVASGRNLERLAGEARLALEDLPAAAGAPEVAGALALMAEALAQGLLVVEKLIEPDRVILGGTVVENDALFESIAQAARRLGCVTPIERSRWGTWSGALGVALEVFRRAGLRISRLTDEPADTTYRVALIQGPNLNLLGEREPEHYGTSSLRKIEDGLTRVAAELGCRLYCVQSNVEGELVSWLQRRLGRLDGVVINPAALTAHGYALLDALTARRLPFVEVHLSNIYNREAWHRESCFAAASAGRVSGMGERGYELALRGLIQHLSGGKTDEHAIG